MIIGKPTSSQEKAWLNRITEYAEKHGAFPLYSRYGFERHHVKGREFKHNKCHIGRWLVLPISWANHNVHSNNEFNVTHYPKRYAAEFGRQVDQFVAMCAVIKSEDGTLPFSDEVMAAIMELNI